VRVDIQWARSRPRDWERVDSADWSATPSKPDPTRLSAPPGLDGTPGWINSLAVQGVEFSGDHYHVEHVSEDEIVVTCWTTTDDTCARVWRFRTLKPDPKFGGAINTDQGQTVYAVPGSLLWERARQTAATVLPWDQFVPPASDVRHCPAMPDALHDEHRARLTVHGWREWTEGVDQDHLDDSGKVAEQRARGLYPVPDGTKTYYASDTKLDTGIHIADEEMELSTSTGSAANLIPSIKKNAEELTAVFTTPSNEPNSAAWPTGAYRWQIDVTAAGADLTYGLLTIGSAAGHFARVNSGLTSELETKTQTDSAYSGTGLKLASTGSVSWTAGMASDRFECCLAAGNANTKNAQTLTIEVNESDDYADGPWTDALYAAAVDATAQSVANAATVANGPAKTAAAVASTGQAVATAATVQSAALAANAVDATAAAAANSPAVVNGPAKTAAAAVATASASTLNATANKESAHTVSAGDATAQAVANAATVANGPALTAEAGEAAAQAIANSAAVTNGPAKTASAVDATALAIANNATAYIETEDLEVAAVAASAQAITNAAAVANGPAKTATSSAATAQAVALSPSVLNGPAKTTAAAVASGAAATLSPSVANGPALTAAAVASTGQAVANAATAIVASARYADATAASGAAVAIAPDVTTGPALTAGGAIASGSASALSPSVANGPPLAAGGAIASAVAAALGAAVQSGPALSPDATVATASAVALFAAGWIDLESIQNKIEIDAAVAEKLRFRSLVTSALDSGAFFRTRLGWRSKS
jgi:hypothetical protein